MSRRFIALIFAVAPIAFAAHNDFDGDGKSDVFWQNSFTGQTAIWFMNGSTVVSAQLVTSRPNEYSQRDPRMADLDGDGKTDLLWYSPRIGRRTNYYPWRLWLMNGAELKSEAFPSVDKKAEFPLVAFGDFTGDGKADFLWKDSLYGPAVLWTMNGTVVQSTKKVSSTTPGESPSGFDEELVAAVGDFNGDGRADVLWRNTTTSNLTIWFSNGPSSPVSIGTPYHVDDSHYSLVGVTDVDHDNKDDFIWWNSSTGEVVIWEMNGASIKAAGLVATVSDLNWHIGATGDFDGDGRGDIIWQNSSTGDVVMWLMNGLSIKTGAYVTRLSDLDWQIYESK